MSSRSRLVTIMLLSGCFFLHGCGSVKKTLGIERDPPDEFSVDPSIQPLDMPPDFFSLPLPEPGAPRPQDVREMAAKKEKLLGSAPGAGTASPAQKALLEMAGSEGKQDDIRRQVDEESHIESAKDKPWLEQLGIKEATPVGEVINPTEETIKLQNQGIAIYPAPAP
ncbi:MAG: hypothetical protein BGO67_11335 [Alphaproteobacteria bacterium 41-28]|nr:MAG: hypothetical protein BGO67_11335 [Alphaproteobacteria bacterium 41-28]